MLFVHWQYPLGVSVKTNIYICIYIYDSVVVESLDIFRVQSISCQWFEPRLLFLPFHLIGIVETKDNMIDWYDKDLCRQPSYILVFIGTYYLYAVIGIIYSSYGLQPRRRLKKNVFGDTQHNRFERICISYSNQPLDRHLNIVIYNRAPIFSRRSFDL